MDQTLEIEIEKSFILHWNYRNLKDCPEELRHFGKHIQDIYLKGNQISKLPFWIVELENLTEIYLTDNHLQELPNEISLLKSLRTLDVSQNKITELPESFTSLTQLSCFAANENLLTCLPKDIGRLKALTFLCVNKNKLKQIPDSIIDCTSLQEIDFEYNELFNLPKSMMYLSNLSYASIRHNNLHYLPAIPFYSQPLILIDGNKKLSYVSYDFFKYLEKRLVPQLDNNESTVHEWPFYQHKFVMQKHPNKRDNHVTVVSERDNVLLFPLDHVHDENSNFVASLYETCLRTVNEICFSKFECYRIIKNRSLLDALPKIIKNELMSGPTALCQRCQKGIYKLAYVKLFMVLLPSIAVPRIEAVQYFCGKNCVLLFSDA